MAQIVLLNKPFQVLSQFSPSEDKTTLAKYVQIPKVYPAGRLDYDSEGLMLLTDDGKLQARIAEPKFKLLKEYWVQVEGTITDSAIAELKTGVKLKDGVTLPAEVEIISAPAVWERDPPIRHRPNQQTSWINIGIKEGKNRQVRRMTAAVGFPTLRLIRHTIGPWSITGLEPGQYRVEPIHLPHTQKPSAKPNRHRNNTSHHRSTRGRR